MQKVALTGTKDSVNKTFTLASASAALTLIIQASKILKVVAITPGANECTISSSGLTVTTGTAPGASDMFFAYILGDATVGIEEVAITGLQNGSNAGFGLSKISPTGSVLIFKNGAILEEVSSSPTSIQYSLTANGFTAGLAPVSTDKLRAFVSSPATGLLSALTVAGKQDSANTRYVSSYIPPPGTEPALFVLIEGVLQTLVINSPLTGQYAQVTPQVFTLGVAPAAATSLQFILIGTHTVTTNPYDFTCLRLARKLGIWLQRNLDEPELEEVVGNSYRELVESYQWSFLQVDGVFATEAIKSAGTVLVTQGSQIVSGTSTTFVAGDIGKRFRLSSFSNSYLVTNVDVANQRLEITPAFVDATATAQTYALIKSIYKLGFDVEYLFSITSRYPMREVSLAKLDRVDPTRFSTSDVPLHYAYRGKSDTGELQIEVYPVPTQATVIRYTGIRRDACVDSGQRLRGVELIVLNTAAAAACRIAMIKPNAKAEVWIQLTSAYEGKAAALLERADTLDWTRSSTAQVQGMRGETNSLANDGDYMSSHDVGLGWEN